MLYRLDPNESVEGFSLMRESVMFEERYQFERQINSVNRKKVPSDELLEEQEERDDR